MWRGRPRPRTSPCRLGCTWRAARPMISTERCAFEVTAITHRAQPPVYVPIRCHPERSFPSATWAGSTVEGPCVSGEIALARDYHFYVYIMQSPSRRALYIGMTNNLHKRVWQHKNHLFEGFSDDYNAVRLVYWESFNDARNAIDREKQLKGWRRNKKLGLIGQFNPEWRALAADWYETQGPSTAAIVHCVNDRPRSG